MAVLLKTTPLGRYLQGTGAALALGLMAGLAGALASPAGSAAPTLSGGIIADLKSLEQRLADDPAGVEAKAESQAERLAGGNASDRWARALYLQLAAGAASAQNRSEEAADHLASARRIDGVEQAQRDRWLRQEIEQRIQARQRQQARTLLEGWLSRHEDAEALWTLAELAAADEDWEAAADGVERAKAADPQPSQARLDFAGGVMHKSGRLDQALAALEARLATDPADADAWRRAAAMAQRLGDPVRAAALWEAGWRQGALSGNDDLERRIELHLAAGTPARAAELLERALAEGVLEDSEPRRRLLAEAWFQARDHDQALDAWQTLAERSDAGSDWLRLGQIAAGWGREQTAREALNRALAKGEDEAQTWLGALSAGSQTGQGAAAEPGAGATNSPRTSDEGAG